MIWKQTHDPWRKWCRKFKKRQERNLWVTVTPRGNKLTSSAVSQEKRTLSTGLLALQKNNNDFVHVWRQILTMQTKFLTSRAHVIEANNRWGHWQRTPTCDEARVCEPVFGVVCVVAQVSDLHVAIVDAENKSQSKGDARCCFAPTDKKGINEGPAAEAKQPLRHKLKQRRISESTCARAYLCV